MEEEIDFGNIPDVLLEEAKLLVDDGENSEYLRGICELLSVYVFTTQDNADNAINIAIHLGIKREIALKMYH
jgi:hypothetical protein